MAWLLFLCVNLFNSGRPIEGRVPSQALAVAVAAGQHSGQQQHHHHQPVHGLGGLPACLPHFFSGWPGLGQAAYAAQRGLGPGNVRVSRTHQLNWAAAARTLLLVPLLGPRPSGHMVGLNLAQLPAGMSREWRERQPTISVEESDAAASTF